jgi:hypothetical protein
MGGVVCAIPDLRAAAPTAKSGRVVRSRGPYGPLHRRPRLRHRPRRRGAASAASRPPPACARAVRKCVPVSAAARGPVRATAETAPLLDGPRERLGCQATFLHPVGSATPSNRCGALPHLAAPGGHHVLVPVSAPVSASSCPGAAHGTVELVRWLLPCLPSHGGFQLHRGRHRRSVTAPPWGCAVLPSLWTSVAGTARAAWARVWQGWRGLAHTLGVRHPQTPASRNGLLVDWSFTGGCGLLRAGLGGGHCPRTACWDSPWGDFPLETSPGSRTRLPLAATFFLLLGSAM